MGCLFCFPSDSRPGGLAPVTEGTYKGAGVDLDVAREVKGRIGAIAIATHGPEVLGGVGAFAGLYRLGDYRDPVLVSGTDGVGTKLKVATIAGRLDNIGEDLVNACVNDVIVCGAKPLLFLDYIAMSRLTLGVVEVLVQGMARACTDAGCALIGGETAQMPGMYAEGDVELVGFAMGVVERRDLLDPSSVCEDDVLVGVPSNGLHTNGYSLVRQVFGLDEDASPLTGRDPRLGEGLGDALLRPHRAYYSAVSPAFPSVKAMAHITGGGLIENVPRMLPPGLAARLDVSTWPVPAIFTVIQERGNIPQGEMYRVFNMGLGMVMACDPPNVDEVLTLVPEAMVVGEVVRSADGQRVIL